MTSRRKMSITRKLSPLPELASDLGIAESGYRLIVNVNDHGGQEVYHIHMHLLGGERVGPMVSKENKA